MVWYVGLTIVTENILFDSIAALGLMIAFYYGLTGFACVVTTGTSSCGASRTFVLVGVAAAAGRADPDRGVHQVVRRPLRPANSASGDSWFGIGPPLIIGIGFLIFGVILMVIWYLTGHRAFFRRKTETAHADALTA